MMAPQIIGVIARFFRHVVVAHRARPTPSHGERGRYWRAVESPHVRRSPKAAPSRVIAGSLCVSRGYAEISGVAARITHGELVWWIEAMREMTMQHAPRWVAVGTILGSMGLFGVACALPALDFRAVLATGVPTPASALVPQPWPGFALLLLGWAGLLSLEVAWFANPLLALAWLALGFRRWRVAFALAAVALLFAADLLLGRTITVIGDTATTAMFVDRVRPGCYLWVASIVVVAFGAAFGWVLTRRRVPVALTGSEGQMSQVAESV